MSITERTRPGARVPAHSRGGAWVRRRGWRAVFAVAAHGVRVTGPVPVGGAVIVANHSSHADTAALLAALPARSAPVAAAAADHWFATLARALTCRVLTGGRPVRRDGGGWDDLLDLVPLLRAGRVVILFPEGTRSRDGQLAGSAPGRSASPPKWVCPSSRSPWPGPRRCCPPTVT